MILICLFFLTLLNASLVTSLEDSVYIRSAWFEYKAKHKRLYKTAEDENLRFNIWKNNIKFINEHNKKFEKGLVTYKLAMNEFGDLTNKEFEKKTNGLDRGLKRQKVNLKTFEPQSNVSIPESFSWLERGYVTPVKNQGTCGSCWAFATVGALEALFYKKTNNLVELSEQVLMDCSTNYGNLGCMGGLLENAYQYVVDHGIVTNDSYPYTYEQATCKAPADAEFKISGYTVTRSGDEDDLVKACALNGPVAVSLDASHDTFRFYSEGIYYEPSCSSTELDHGVLMVGYGVDKETGIKYYEIKNSWGESWGNKGYAKMIRDKQNNCGIATDSSFPFL